MNIKRSYAVFVRYMYLLFGNPQRLVPLLIWVTLDIVLWGFITKYLDIVGNAGFSFVPVLLGAIVLSDFLSRVQQGIYMPFMEDVWSRNLINFFASPLRIEEYLLGLIISGIVASAIGLVLMITIAFLAFGLSMLQFGFALVGFLSILFLFGVALGIFGSAIVLRLGPSGEWYVWPLVTALTPFVGVFYPVSVLPAWMQLISRMLPPSYVFDSARGIITGGHPAGSEIVLGLVLALVYLVLAYMFFVYIHRRAVKSGAIMRYSAEDS